MKPTQYRIIYAYAVCFAVMVMLAAFSRTFIGSAFEAYNTKGIGENMRKVSDKAHAESERNSREVHKMLSESNMDVERTKMLLEPLKYDRESASAMLDSYLKANATEVLARRAFWKNLIVFCLGALVWLAHFVWARRLEVKAND